jgi:hypothetical protein
MVVVNRHGTLAAVTPKQRQRWTERVAPMLATGESVLVVTRSRAPLTSRFALLKRVAIGVLPIRAVLVFTNARLFCFFIDGSPSVVSYGDIVDTQMSGFINRRLKLRYRNGAFESFPIDTEDRKSIATIGGLFVHDGPTATGGRQFLCPRCFRAILAGEYVCGGCGQTFKSPDEARRRVLALTGMGYFYVGEYTFGVMASWIELGWVWSLIVAILALGRPGRGSFDVLVYLVVIIAIEKAISTHHVLTKVATYLPE